MKARILRIIARASEIGVVYISAIHVRYFRAPRGPMFKKLLVALAILAPVLVSVVDQARLGAQSGAGVVISEFRTRGPVGGNDEFVELFNATAAAVDISGWKIRGSNAAGTVSDRVTIPAATTLGPGCFYLVINTAASGYSGSVAGNLTYSTGITDDGGLALTRGDNSIVDQAGMSAGSAFGEGTRLAAFGGTNGDRAYARTPTAGSDSGDNATDFVMTTPSGPQNLASVAGCARAAGRSGRRRHQSGLRRRREQRVGLHQRLHRDLQSRSRPDQSRRLVGAVRIERRQRRGR